MSTYQQRRQAVPGAVNRAVEPPDDLRAILVHLNGAEFATLLPLRDAYRAQHQDPHATMGDAIRAAVAAAYRNLVEGAEA